MVISVNDFVPNVCWSADYCNCISAVESICMKGGKVFPEFFASGQIRFIFPATCRAIYSFETNSNILFVSFDSESTLQSETKRTGWHPVQWIIFPE